MYKSIPVGLVEIHIIGNPAPIFRAQVTPSQSFGPPTDSDVAADQFFEIPNWVNCHPMYPLVIKCVPNHQPAVNVGLSLSGKNIYSKTIVWGPKVLIHTIIVLRLGVLGYIIED